MIRLLRPLLILSIAIFISCNTVLIYAQQESQSEDPAAQLSTEEQSTERDVSEYTDNELIDLYLNDPQKLPEMDDETLNRISQLARESQNTQTE